MNQEIKEVNVLNVSDGSFVVRTTQGTAPDPVIKTAVDFPKLVTVLQDMFFSVPQAAQPAPATQQ